MKKIMSLLMFCFHSTILFSQNTVFNKYFEATDTSAIGTYTCLPTNDGYFLGGHETIAIQGDLYRSICIRKTDFYGNTVWKKQLDSGAKKRVITTGNALIKTSDNSFAIAGSRANDAEGDDMDAILIKFDEAGEVIWKQSYGTTALEKAYGVITTNDNGYYIYGFQGIGPNPFTFYCIKTDNLGNEQWTQTYSLEGSSIAFSAHQTADDGFIISGYGNHSTQGYQMYVVRTNSVGTQLWEQHYGWLGNEQAGMLTPLPNNTYLLTAHKEENGLRKIYLAELSTNGFIIWDKTIQGDFILQLQTPLKLLDDGNYIATGYAIEYNNAPIKGLAVKFNSQLDTLWTQTYKTYPDDDDYFRDIEPTPDGGFLLAGFNYTQNGSWLVKIDSLGNTCSYLGCDSVGIDTAIPSTFIEEEQEFSLTPNPATSQTLLKYQLPPNIAFGVVELFNQQGQKVHHQLLPQATTQQTIQLGHLGAGVYVYKVVVVGGKVLRSGKLVIF